MITFEATNTINAPADVVWATLTDTAAWPDWDSGVVSVTGTPALGAKLKITSAVDPGRAFPVKVTTLDANERMVFTGGMPFGLFKGERTYTLTSVPAGTQITMREVFSGPMLKLIARTLPDLQPSFDQFVGGLQSVVEAEPQTDHTTTQTPKGA